MCVTFRFNAYSIIKLFSFPSTFVERISELAGVLFFGGFFLFFFAAQLAGP